MSAKIVTMLFMCNNILRLDSAYIQKFLNFNLGSLFGTQILWLEYCSIFSLFYSHWKKSK